MRRHRPCTAADPAFRSVPDGGVFDLSAPFPGRNEVQRSSLFPRGAGGLGRYFHMEPDRVAFRCFTRRGRRICSSWPTTASISRLAHPMLGSGFHAPAGLPLLRAGLGALTLLARRREAI